MPGITPVMNNQGHLHGRQRSRDASSLVIEHAADPVAQALSWLSHVIFSAHSLFVCQPTSRHHVVPGHEWAPYRSRFALWHLCFAFIQVQDPSPAAQPCSVLPTRLTASIQPQLCPPHWQGIGCRWVLNQALCLLLKHAWHMYICSLGWA